MSHAWIDLEDAVTNLLDQGEEAADIKTQVEAFIEDWETDQQEGEEGNGQSQ